MASTAALPCLSAAAFAHDSLEEICGVGANGFGNCDEFGDVDLALIALDHANDRVRAFEARREIPLGEAGVFARGGDDGSHGLGRGTS
jgi:hypothetical protein